MSYVSIARFDVKTGAREAFLQAFEATGMLSRPKSIPGFRWAKLAESVDGSEFVVLGEWDSQDDYAAWQAISLRALDKSLARTFVATFQDPQPGKLYRTIETSGD